MWVILPHELSNPPEIQYSHILYSLKHFNSNNLLKVDQLYYGEVPTIFVVI